MLEVRGDPDTHKRRRRRGDAPNAPRKTDTCFSGKPGRSVLQLNLAGAFFRSDGKPRPRKLCCSKGGPATRGPPSNATICGLVAVW